MRRISRSPVNYADADQARRRRLPAKWLAAMLITAAVGQRDDVRVGQEDLRKLVHRRRHPHGPLRGPGGGMDGAVVFAPRTVVGQVRRRFRGRPTLDELGVGPAPAQPALALRGPGGFGPGGVDRQRRGVMG